jgi:tetratricopeptide (TPR) repeat protein
LELGLDLARQSNSRELEIKLLYEFGAEFVDRGQHKNAKQYLSRAFDIAQEIGERKEAQFIKGQLANVLVAEGRLDEAVDILHRILNQWQDFEHETDRMLAHTTLHALGRVFLRQGRYLEAQRVLSESMQLKMHLDSGKGLVARTRCLLAEAYMGLDSISEAESHLIESIQASKDVGDSRYVALGYKNMAHLQCKLRNYQNAEANLALATSFAQQSQNPNIIFNIALMRIKTGILSGRIRSAYRGFVIMTQVLDDIKFSPLATSRVFLNRLKYL